MAYNHNLSVFTRIVKAMAGRYKQDSLHNSDDIEQECWTKIIQIMPRLNQVPPDEVTLFANVVIKNHVADIVNKSMKRAKINGKFKSDHASWSEHMGGKDWLFDEKMDVETFKTTGLQLHQDDIVSFNKLAEHLRSWAADRPGIPQKLVEEIIEPSPKTLDMWREMVEQHRYLSHYHSIPPASLAKVLGCSKVTICRIMQEIKFYLETIGYDKRYLAQL